MSDFAGFTVKGLAPFDVFNPKKNDLFWVNWILVFIGIAIMWKYRTSHAFWMGVVAIIIIGIRVSNNRNSMIFADSTLLPESPTLPVNTTTTI